MDSDDEPLCADDIKFFKKRSSSASFLMRDQGIDPDCKDKTQKRREQEREEAARKKERARLDQLQGRGKDDDGEDEGPRRSKHWLEEEENERKQGLPVKMADGSVKKVMREHALPDPDTVEEEPAMSKRARKRARGELVAEKKARERGEVYIKPGSAPPQAEEKAETGQLAAAEPEKKGKGKLGGSPAVEEVKLLTHDEKKTAIADICSKLMHNPEQHMSSLTRLHHFCNDTDASIAKLAMISQAMVFADILPDYRIRLPTEKEKEMKVSKEVAQQRAFEAAMLGGYQRFLQLLEAAGRRAEVEAKAFWDSGQEEAVQGCMLAVVVSAMSMLQKRRPTFNFANNLLQSLARRCDSPVPPIANLALAGLKDTIENSSMNEHVKNCITTLSEVIKKKDRRVNPQVLQVFLSLKITSDMLSGPSKRKKLAKGEVDDEEERDLEASMMEGSASIAKSEVKRLSMIVLDSVLTSYFRVLKFDPPASALLPPVLEGLSRFAHLVNIDFFSDLLQAIKALLVYQSAEVEGERALSVASSLHCVVCVFRCLKNQGEVWEMDLQDFYDVLFQCVFRIAAASSEFVHVPLLLEALELTLYDLRQLSSDRVAGFAKRLLSLSLCLEPQKAIAVLSFVRMLFTRYPKTRRLVETDHACVGVYNAELGNAELSNALASTAWELAVLHSSFHAHVRTAAREIAGMATESNQDQDILRSMITTKSTEALLRLYDTSAGGFNPPIKLPSPHPLQLLFEKRVKKKIKGQDSRAIELFVEHPKAQQGSTFLRAVTERAADACAARVAAATRPRGMIEMAEEEGGGGLFACSAMKRYFEHRSAAASAVAARRRARGSAAAARSSAIASGASGHEANARVATAASAGMRAGQGKKIGAQAGQGKKKMAAALGTAGIRKATSSSAAGSTQRKHVAAAAPGTAVSKTSVCSAKQLTKMGSPKAEHVGEQSNLRAVAVSKASMARGREA